MPTIYYVATVTTLIALGLIGGALLSRAPKRDRGLLAAAVLLTVTLSPLALYLARLPFDRWFHPLMAGHEGLYRFLTTFYAPFTEEPAKLWPLLIPAFARRLRRDNAVCVAMALGLGFGIGELWMIAAQIAGVPWYQFIGYANERLLVTFFHGVFTAVALSRFRRGFIFGILGAMAFHYGANFPIYLMWLDVGGIGKAPWQVIISIYLIIYFFIMAPVLSLVKFGKLQPGRLFFGVAKCPACGAIYARPLWGINLGKRRYERCRQCKKWHMTDEYKKPDVPEPAEYK